MIDCQHEADAWYERRVARSSNSRIPSARDKQRVDPPWTARDAFSRLQLRLCAFVSAHLSIVSTRPGVCLGRRTSCPSTGVFRLPVIKRRNDALGTPGGTFSRLQLLRYIFINTLLSIVSTRLKGLCWTTSSDLLQGVCNRSFPSVNRPSPTMGAYLPHAKI